MAQNTVINNYKGLGLPTILSLIFVVLKLTGHIDWPWIWVVSPAWISVGLFIVAALCIGFVIAIRDS